jgi:hypothetical protein
MASTSRHGRTSFPANAVTCGVSLALALAAPLPAQAQEPTLWDVLVRATLYVEDLHAQLSGVVMEERYQQRATLPGRFRQTESAALQRATLRSDYLLVQPEGAERHFGFRDVFEANGARVRDREERLAELFLGGATSVDRQVEGILADSARYNVGDVQRNLNTPTLPLLFLRRSYKARFDFERVSDVVPGLEMNAPDPARGVWVVAYRETAPDTVIRRRSGVNLPSRGRYWIEPETGRVLITELVIEDENVDATITVRYETPADLDHPVPVEMRELYLNHLSGSRVEGTATYSRFRRFRVVVEESEPFRD